MDDTKLVKQIIVSEIISSLPKKLNDKYGKKVLLSLLSSGDPAHSVREIVEVLQKGDGNAYSKKGRDLSQGALRIHLPGFVKDTPCKDTPKEWNWISLPVYWFLTFWELPLETFYLL